MSFSGILKNLELLSKDKLKEFHISGLWGASRALISYKILVEWEGPIIFIVSSVNEMERFYQDLQFFINTDKPYAKQPKQEKDKPNKTKQKIDFFEPITSMPNENDLQEAENRFQNGVGLFPPWEIMPLEAMSPFAALSHQRLTTLYNILTGKSQYIITTIPALMKRNIPLNIIENNSFELELFQDYDREHLLTNFHNMGYKRVDIVEIPGEYAARGGVIDIFIPSYLRPIRVEFLGDQIESLREFEIITQRSKSQLLSVDVIPAREFVYSKDGIQRAIKRCNEIINSNMQRNIEVDFLSNRFERRTYFEGIEWHQPFLYEKLSLLFEYFPSNTLIINFNGNKEKYFADNFEKIVHSHFRHFKPDKYPYFPEENFYASSAEFLFNLSLFPQISCSLFSESNTLIDEHKQLSAAEKDSKTSLKENNELINDSELYSIDSSQTAMFSSNIDEHSIDYLKPEIEMQPEAIPLFHGNLKNMCSFLPNLLKRNYNVTILTRNDDERSLVMQTIDDYFFSLEDKETVLPQSGSLDFINAKLSQGFILSDLESAFITTHELFHEKKKQVKSKRYRGEELISSFRDLKIGDYVVHVDHGIGCYKGTKEITVEDVIRDFLIIEYAGEDKLLLPVERINLVQRYSTGENAVKISLDKLGASRWSKVKEKVKQSIREMAAELISLYASRELLSGFKHPADDQWQREFELAFPYEETPDQLQAIIDTKADMETAKPMDRLICGDVGFGKTEVAMRAAFKAVNNNCQIALIAPTTILAQQHYFTFKERFEAFPITVNVISRFRSKSEQKQILSDLAEGKIDIIIGTHRLLQKDISFKNLGLIIIDEEHRFGVAHKERLKKLRKKADVLTLTATPIPRTLHMSISGLRDMSIINTPPENRLAILTKVLKFNDESIQKAITREIQRGGQVFFVHNRVKTIYSLATYLKRLMPDISIGVAHGQMQKGELKRVMKRFIEKEFDILVCTTIIESGIDMPSVNTMIINRADKLGLAQLYQLRGRVGRANQRAYCYLLIPDFRLLSKVAKQRLKVIQELTELGSGFRIASHDLEIRGAGNLLGAQQHGHVNAVGFDLYCSLLEQAVSDLKGNEQKKEIKTQITVPIEAYIPKTFIPDTNQRLMIYRQLAAVDSQVELQKFEDELRDRFGQLPILIQRMLEIKSLNLECNSLGITRLEIGKGTSMIYFDKQISFQPALLIHAFETIEVDLSFPASYQAKIKIIGTSAAEMYKIMKQVIKKFKQLTIVFKETN